MNGYTIFMLLLFIVYGTCNVFAQDNAQLRTRNCTYTVVSGDILYDIAIRVSSTVAELQRMNPDTADPSTLHVGQNISYPCARVMNVEFKCLYTVVAGDTLDDIATRLSTTVTELRRLNLDTITDPNTLQTGQKIEFPCSHITKSSTCKYTAVKDDTLEKIAYKFGTTKEELEKLNQLPNPNSILIGQTILYPCKTGASGSQPPLPSGLSPAEIAGIVVGSITGLGALFGLVATIIGIEETIRRRRIPKTV